MSAQVTRKFVVNSCSNIKKCEYCDLQYLLRYQNPSYFTRGVYGWNFDVYLLPGLTLCTGYRGMPGERLEGIKEYEDKARKIYENYSLSYEQRVSAIATLLDEFCKLNGGY